MIGGALSRLGSFAADAFGGECASALCHQKQNSDRTQYTYTIVGFAGPGAGARWISRMSPWCTVAT